MIKTFLASLWELGVPEKTSTSSQTNTTELRAGEPVIVTHSVGKTFTWSYIISAEIWSSYKLYKTKMLGMTKPESLTNT